MSQTVDRLNITRIELHLDVPFGPHDLFNNKFFDLHQDDLTNHFGKESNTPSENYIMYCSVTPRSDSDWYQTDSHQG